MLQGILEILKEATNINQTLIPIIYMSIRGTFIYFGGIILSRINRRFMGIRTSFNFLLYVMTGSLAAAGILEERYFFPVAGTLILLTLVNGLVAKIAFHYPKCERLLKGSPIYLIREGKVQKHIMKKYYVTEEELESELETQLHTHDFSVVDTAILASNGTINFIKKD